MSNLSTDDCKAFLVAVHTNTKSKEWKRISKYKNEQGLWCRGFNHPVIGNVSLLEKNGELSIITSESIPSTTPVVNESTVFVRSFSEKEISDAKKLVAAYLNDEYPEPEDKGYTAIPSQVSYMFSMADEENEARLKEINEKEDYNSTLSVCVLDIRPINEDGFDSDMSPLIKEWLPDGCMGESMECTFVFEFDEPLSVKDIVQLMASKGFIYDPGLYNDEPPACFLYETIKKLSFVEHKGDIKTDKKQKKQKDSVSDTFLADFLNVVKTDDDFALQSLLFNKMPLNMMVNRISIHSYCFLNDAPKCFKLLVDSTPDMAVGQNGKANTIWDDMACYSQKPSNFDYITYLFDYSRYNFKDKSYLANISFISNILRNEWIFSAYKDKVTEVFLAATCLLQCITNEDNYKVSYMKEYADLAIVRYPNFVNQDYQLLYFISNDVIIEPILNKMIEVGNIKIDGHPLKDFLTQSVKNFKHSKNVLNEFDVNGYIQYYEKAIAKINAKNMK